MFAGALQTPGLGWLIAAALLAGVVRGFSGFGTAMVYLPVAGQVLGPFEALTTLTLMDLVGPLPNVPRALREGRPADVARLGAGLVLALPLGLWTLGQVSPEVFRYAVSTISLLLLGLLAAGFRYRGRLSPPLVFGTGALGGFLGGVSGLSGPPVIMLYMASALPAAAVRANTLLYLLMGDVVLMGVMAASGVLVPAAVGLGILLILPYTLANMAGAAMFRPGGETLYRRAAYVIIAASALSGLPLWE